MGYFSRFATQYPSYSPDHSATPPQTMLLWRLDALERQLEQLRKQTCGCIDAGLCFDRQELLFAPEESFVSVTDVLEAMDLVILELAQRYGIHIRQEPGPVPVADEVTLLQLSFLDMLPVCPVIPGFFAA